MLFFYSPGREWAIIPYFCDSLAYFVWVYFKRVLCLIVVYPPLNRQAYNAQYPHSLWQLRVLVVL